MGRRPQVGLTNRQQRILVTLCRGYLVTGKPVSSTTLARTQGLRWSSATIRAELVALERLGYLIQPHHASGRLPTSLALSTYVGVLQQAPSAPPQSVRRAVDLSLSKPVDSPSSLRPATHVLSQIVGCVAVAFVGEAQTGVIKRIELVPMQQSSALVLLELDSGPPTVQPIALDASVVAASDARALANLQERLQWFCRGRTLAEARELLATEMAAEEARVDALLAEGLRVGLWICMAASLEPLWLQVAGRRLLASAGHSMGGQALEQVLGLLEDYHRLAEVLCQLLPGSDEADLRAQVCVGLDSSLDAPHAHQGAVSSSGLSVVGCRLPGGSGRTGVVAMLGSDRMDYERVIPLVEYAAGALIRISHSGSGDTKQ